MSGHFITDYYEIIVLEALAKQCVPIRSKSFQENRFEFEGEKWTFWSDHVLTKDNPPETLTERLFAFKSSISRVLLIPMKGKYLIFVG